MLSLERKWSLYFHSKDKSKCYSNNTFKLIDIDSVQTLWGTLNNIPLPKNAFSDGKIFNVINVNNCKYSLNAYSFFQHEVQPTWEDPQNKSGAEWSVRRFKGLHEISDWWIEFIISVVSEEYDICKHIKGIRIVDSTLPNKPMYRLEVWFDNIEKTEQVHDYIKQTLKVKGALLYRVHSEVKEF